MDMDTQNLLTATKARIEKITSESKKNNKKRRFYPEDVRKNLYQLSRHYSSSELSRILNLSSSGLRYIIKNEQSSNKATHTIIKPKKEKSDVIQFVDLSHLSGPMNETDKKKFSHQEHKVFMKLTTPSGVIVEIFQ